MAEFENGGPHTEADHVEYLTVVREKLREVADLIVSAPCTHTLTEAAVMVGELSTGCAAVVLYNQLLIREEDEREERAKRVFGLS